MTLVKLEHKYFIFLHRAPPTNPGAPQGRSSHAVSPSQPKHHLSGFRFRQHAPSPPVHLDCFGAACWYLLLPRSQYSHPHPLYASRHSPSHSLHWPSRRVPSPRRPPPTLTPATHPRLPRSLFLARTFFKFLPQGNPTAPANLSRHGLGNNWRSLQPLINTVVQEDDYPATTETLSPIATAS